MANNKPPAKQENKPPVVKDSPIKEFFAHPSVVDKFKEIMGNNAPAFITSVLQIAATDNLKHCIPKTIFTAAAVAATLNLPINPQLGLAYIIPYGDEAQFQIGWRGFVQLALRTGYYEKINVREVYENQFKSWNGLTEEFNADYSKKGEGAVVGYVAYFKLLAGFIKVDYWTRDEVTTHAKTYSKSFNHSKSQWQNGVIGFNSMSKKTVLKNILQKWGPLSVELQRAIIADQAVINDIDTLDGKYPDNPELADDEMKTRSAGALGTALKMMDKHSNNQQQ